MTEIEIHLPERPRWRCVDDGQSWPCDSFKARLRERYGRDGVAMSAAMAPWMVSARHDVALSALQLHDRFAGWIPGWLAKEISD